MLEVEVLEVKEEVVEFVPRRERANPEFESSSDEEGDAKKPTPVPKPTPAPRLFPLCP